MRPEDYCDEPAEDEFGEIIKCRSGKSVGVRTLSCVESSSSRSVLVFVLQCVFTTMAGRLYYAAHAAQILHIPEFPGSVFAYQSDPIEP